MDTSPAPPAAAGNDWLTDLASSSPMAAALLHGLHNAAGGFGSTASVLGAPETGQAIADAVPDPKNYQSALDPLKAAWDRGRYAEALSYLPRAAAETLPDVAGAGLSGLAGTALGGPVGGAAGVMAYTGGRDFGDNAKAEAATNGDATPTGADMARAAGWTAAEGAGSVLLGRLASSGVGRAARVAGDIRDALQEGASADPVRSSMVKAWLLSKAADVWQDGADDDAEERARKAQFRSVVNKALRLMETVTAG